MKGSTSLLTRRRSTSRAIQALPGEYRRGDTRYPITLLRHLTPTIGWAAPHSSSVRHIRINGSEETETFVLASVRGPAPAATHPRRLVAPWRPSRHREAGLTGDVRHDGWETKARDRPARVIREPRVPPSKASSWIGLHFSAFRRRRLSDTRVWSDARVFANVDEATPRRSTAAAPRSVVPFAKLHPPSDQTGTHTIDEPGRIMGFCEIRNGFCTPSHQVAGTVEP